MKPQKLGPLGLLAFLLTIAYTPSESQVHVSFSAGGGASNVSMAQGPEQAADAGQAKGGFNGGITLDIPLQKQERVGRFYCSPTIFFVQNGCKDQPYYTSTGQLEADPGDLSLTYFGLSLPAKFVLQKNPGTMGLYLSVGGYFDFVSNATISSDKTDFGFKSGLGLCFPAADNRPAFSIELGYSKGLNNIQFYTQAADYTVPPPNSFSNSLFTISVGVRF